MQKTITLLTLFMLSFGLFSCSSTDGDAGSDTPKVLTPKEIVERELLSFIEVHNNGVKPGIAIEEIKKHDANTEPHINEFKGKKTDLGYKSEVVEGKVTIKRDYRRRHIKKELLKSMKVYISIEEERDEETNKLLSETLDLATYKSFLEKNLPEGGKYEEVNGDDTWAYGEYGEYRAVLSQYSETDIVLTFRKW